jgi:hypothetical protein
MAAHDNHKEKLYRQVFQMPVEPQPAVEAADAAESAERDVGSLVAP